MMIKNFTSHSLDFCRDHFRFLWVMCSVTLKTCSIATLLFSLKLAKNVVMFSVWKSESLCLQLLTRKGHIFAWSSPKRHCRNLASNFTCLLGSQFGLGTVGWYGLPCSILTSKSLHSCLITSLINSPPLSDWITVGTPCLTIGLHNSAHLTGWLAFQGKQPTKLWNTTPNG